MWDGASYLFGLVTGLLFSVIWISLAILAGRSQSPDKAQQGDDVDALDKRGCRVVGDGDPPK